jgi:hypothetical protein
LDLAQHSDSPGRQKEHSCTQGNHDAYHATANHQAGLDIVRTYGQDVRAEPPAQSTLNSDREPEGNHEPLLAGRVIVAFAPQAVKHGIKTCTQSADRD